MKKKLVSLYSKENDTLFFDQGENRGNVEVCRVVERGSERERRWVCQQKKSQKEKQKATKLGRYRYQSSDMAGCDM